MAAIEKPQKTYNYGDVHISLENCILPDDKLSETPSMKDGLDKDVETDLRILGCEFIQTAGILLKLPQVSEVRPVSLFRNYWLPFIFNRLSSLFFDKFNRRLQWQRDRFCFNGFTTRNLL